ncbi:MAG: HEAT repeat domain-containing protein, partial [Pirellulales bacterium]|nr:HEAT repeat domain-containing protein [Pirellulales bacterium]
DNGIPPESEEVRVAAVIALGRMKAESAIPMLRRYYPGGPAFGTMDYACGWALSQITGEPVPVIEPYVDSRSGWFLEPFDEKNELRY